MSAYETEILCLCKVLKYIFQAVLNLHEVSFSLAPSRILYALWKNIHLMYIIYALFVKWRNQNCMEYKAFLVLAKAENPNRIYHILRTLEHFRKRIKTYATTR